MFKKVPEGSRMFKKSLEGSRRTRWFLWIQECSMINKNALEDSRM